MSTIRERLETALAKPLPDDEADVANPAKFDPWKDVIDGISGSYSSDSDALFVSTLRAVRNKTTFELIYEKGFAVEFALYVLAGHSLLEYGVSPRGGWPDPAIADLWQPLIDKWTAYAAIAWSEPLAEFGA